MGNFSGKIYGWYKKNKRDLPWRKTQNPYQIWLSEIILQQTRVIQGINYYNRFIERFPEIKNLAEASQDEVLKLWQGLGYYSRARNMHSTARQIIEKYNGNFPSDHKSILKLKGIGPYTAAAISSIAFNQPYPAIDGNVFRVLSRYFGMDDPIDTKEGKNKIENIALELMTKKDPGFHNQAMMEFGALQCTPKSPECSTCPLKSSCYAYINRLTDQLPVKSKKTKQRNRFFLYYYIDCGKSTFLEKRTGNDIWKNLYQFPLEEIDHFPDESELLQLDAAFLKDLNVNVKSVSKGKKHILSHQIIHARLLHVEIKETDSLRDKFIHVNKKDIYKFAVPRLLEHFFEELYLK